jgi:DNA-directed RNA polymerase subunit RPC12/RpoP
MQKKTSIALIVVLFGSAGALYYWRAGGVNDITSRRDYNASLHCLSCGQDFGANLQVADVPPVTCPNCRKTTGWYRWECGSCGNQFTPPPGGDPPRQPMISPCPKCNSSMTGRMGGVP